MMGGFVSQMTAAIASANNSLPARILFRVMGK